MFVFLILFCGSLRRVQLMCWRLSYRLLGQDCLCVYVLLLLRCGVFVCSVILNVWGVVFVTICVCLGV